MLKFIYFDIGGVTIRDFSKTDKWRIMKEDIGIKKEMEKEFDLLFKKYEDEELNLTRHVDSLIPLLSKKFGISFPTGFSMLDYFVDHFEKNESLFPILTMLKKSYRIGLLTNMYLGMLEKIKIKKLLPNLAWDAIIDSSIVKAQKPDEKIYLIAQKNCGHQPEEILFVDNNEINLEAPKRLGWQTLLYDSADYEKSNKKLLDFLPKR